MKTTEARLLALLTVLLLPMVATAGPIAVGDSVNVSYDYPSIGTSQCGAGDVKTTSVAADASDVVTVLDCFSDGIILSVDMNESGFTSEWNTFVDLIFLDPFDGLVISGIDWLFTPTSLIVDTNLPGWAAFGVAAITPDGMSFNFAGIDTNGALPVGTYYFNVRAVPEPSTLALFGLGLLGLGFARRRA